MTLPKLLLLVEDDEGLAELFQQALVETRMPIIWVRTGKEALSHIQKTPESLLLLDYSLPDMDYLRLLKDPRVKTRFDIVEVLLEDGSVATVRHLPNTFPLSHPLRHAIIE